VEETASRDRTSARPHRLRFPPEVEAAFARYHFRQSLPFMRFAVVLALVLYAAFGLLDLFIVPGHAASIWVVRYAVVCPSALLVLGLTYTDRLRA
jgi:hypothetical protein